MSHTNCRKFNLMDAMVLIAATAPALAFLRSDFVRATFSEPLDSYGDYPNRIMNIFYVLSIGFGPWSLAFLILRLRRPRPALRRLTRQPGMVACTAATVVLAIRLVNYFSVAWALSNKFPGRSFRAWVFVVPTQHLDDLMIVPSGIGCAVAAAWMVQAIAGRWRPERCWIDRAGRIAGAFWIASLPSSWFSFVIN